jgi:putative transposase
VLGQHRPTGRKVPCGADDEQRLTDDVIALAKQYGLIYYSYRRVTALLRDAGWMVNWKPVERIWRKERLKVPQRQPKRGRLWLTDKSCIRLRPKYPGYVWAEQPDVPAMPSIVGMAADGYGSVEGRTQ